jgi:hypothetical protein
LLLLRKFIGIDWLFLALGLFGLLGLRLGILGDLESRITNGAEDELTKGLCF